MKNNLIFKDNYLKSYSSYIKDPYSNYNKQLMINSIFEYGNLASIWTEELYEIFLKEKTNIKNPKEMKDFLILKSSGSSNFFSSFYKWGPNTFYFIEHIWKFYHKRFIFKDKFWINLTNNRPSRFPFQRKDRTNLHCEGISSLINFNDIEESSERIKNSIWILNPIVLNKLIENNKIIEIIKKNNISISITEVDSSFYDFSILDENNIQWTNQMRSWKEGTGFYTCSFKEKHFSENFFFCTEDKKVVDLFNYFNDWWDNESCNPDNIFSIEKNFRLCECGTWYRKMNFEPQAIKWFRNKYNEVANYYYFNSSLLKNKYEFIQIIQTKDIFLFELHVPNGIIFDEDKVIIRNFIDLVLETSDFRIIIKEDIYTVGAGNKIPIFWSEI